MTTQELIQRIGRAKATIDNGFSRVGPRLQDSGPAGLALFGGAGRIVRLSNAVVLLCKSHHEEEARPLLKEIGAAALLMSGIAMSKEAGELPKELNQFWSDPAWKNRLAASGSGEKDWKIFESAFAERQGVFSPGWAEGLPWAHAAGTELRRVEADDVLSAALRAMERALEALAVYWPEIFAESK